MAADAEYLLGCLMEQGKDHAIILLDPAGTIVGWLPGAEKTFGYAFPEVVGRNVALLFTPEDVANGISEHELAVARSNGRAEDDRWLVRKDGSRFWATGTAVALYDAGQSLVGFGKVLRDRTESREHTETLRNDLHEAREADERKNRFIALLGHEVRNPLNVIALCAHGLDRLASGPAAELVATLHKQVAFMLRLVEDLQEASRAEANRIALKVERIVLQDVLRRAAEGVRPHAERRRQVLQTLLVPAGIEVDIDPDRIHQAVTNLLENAVKYTHDGGRIWLKCTTEGNEAVIRVEDDGKGIDKAALPALFELFTRSQSIAGASDGLGAGLGLGLPLVRQLVALHGGSVQVRSDGPGKGSEFIIRLPRPM
jgi:two-component system CheB/CheR fusion protein